MRVSDLLASWALARLLPRQDPAPPFQSRVTGSLGQGRHSVCGGSLWSCSVTLSFVLCTGKWAPTDKLTGNVRTGAQLGTLLEHLFSLIQTQMDTCKISLDPCVRGVSVHTYILAVWVPRQGGSRDTPVIMSTPSIRNLASITVLETSNQGSLEKKAASRTEAGKRQNEPGCLWCQKGSMCLKNTHTHTCAPHTHTNSHPLRHTPCTTHSLTHSYLLAQPTHNVQTHLHSLTHPTHTHSHTHSLSPHTHTHSHVLTLTHSLSHTCVHTLTLTCTHSHPLA